MKKVSCTWGDGPDIILSIESDFFILYEDPKHKFILYEDPKHIKYPKKGDWLHGYVTKGSMDLTADEALALGGQLIEAANNAKELDRMCENHDEKAQQIEDNIRKWANTPLTKEEIDAMNDKPLEELTCHKCKHRDKCKYVDDLYNTDGDCLMMK